MRGDKGLSRDNSPYQSLPPHKNTDHLTVRWGRFWPLWDGQRRGNLTSLAVAVISLAISCCASGKILPGLYDLHELADLRKYFEEQVGNVVKESIEPGLRGERLQTSKRIKLNFPIAGQGGGPLEFYARDSTVTLPILSLTFLQDLVVAYIWQDVNGCRSTVLEYVNLLKYREVGSLPGGRYLNPIEALGIPSPNTATLARMKPEFRARLQRVFYGTLLFITAHEIGHIMLGHRGFSSVAKEIAADNFAFDILAYNQIDPSGVMVFFLLSSLWLPNEEELRAAQVEADHLMNGERVRALGLRLVGHPEQYYPGADVSDPRVPMLKLIGAKFINLGKDLDNLARREELRQQAQNTDPSKLVGCQPK